MKKLIFFLFLISLPHLFAQNKWEFIDKFQGIPSGFAVVDSNTIFSIETNGLPNWVRKTTDQGKSWKLTTENEFHFKAQFIKHIAAKDSLSVFVTFSKGTGPNKEKIFRSFDGGKSFEPYYLDSLGTIIGFIAINENVAISNYTKLFISTNNWQSFETFRLYKDTFAFWFENIRFLNDSIMVCVCHLDEQIQPKRKYFMHLNVYTKEYELFLINLPKRVDFFDLAIADENNYYLTGMSNVIPGGSGNDIVYKTTDAGKTWKCVLDLFTRLKISLDQYPMGLQSIAFKDKDAGITVGQGGKIVYTYDGGETWIYEDHLPDSLGVPNTMIVRYAGTVPIIATFRGHVFRYQEDNLAPKTTDTAKICGRVTFNGVGQGQIPVLIGNRVTMTDDDGYYRFSRLAPGNYTVRAMNKFIDRNPGSIEYNKPFIYTPDSIEVEVTDVVCDLDFTAKDNRKYYFIRGYIFDSDPDSHFLSGVTIHINEHTIKASHIGYYLHGMLESHKMYNIIPEREGYRFEPPIQYIELKSDTSNINFMAYPLTSKVEQELQPQMLRQAGNRIFIESEDVLLSDCTLTISDLSGRELLRTVAKPEQSISDFPRGMYIATLRCGNNILESLKVMRV